MREFELRQYGDYRAFLVGHFQRMRMRRHGWSYGVWARSLGLKSTSSLTKVIQGKRHPGSAMMERLVCYFQFESDDAQYFRDLVQLQKLKRDPQLFFSLATRLKESGDIPEPRLVEEQEFRAIANWYFYAIREMVRLDKFFENPGWIRRKLRFPVREVDISKALKILVDLGLLKKDSRGKLIYTDRCVDTRNDVVSEAIRQHHDQMLSNAKVALYAVDVHERDFNSVTVTFDTKNLKAAQKKIRKFKKDFAKQFGQDRGNAVYQMQTQFFPLTMIQGVKS